jgi:RNA polymerase sigma-70 factor (ECF subfamily)
MRTVGTVEELFEREYVRLVRALAVAFDAEAASDAVQEGFIAADRRWSEVAALGDPAGWVRRVALNRLRSDRRLRRRRHEILETVRPVAETDLRAELLDLRQAIDDLPDRQRVAVCLFHLSGLSIEEVAGALGVSAGTVKSNLHDARRRLRSCMEEHQHG